jgi:hypothetical protein
MACQLSWSNIKVEPRDLRAGPTNYFYHLSQYCSFSPSRARTNYKSFDVGTMFCPGLLLYAATVCFSSLSSAALVLCHSCERPQPVEVCLRGNELPVVVASSASRVTPSISFPRRLPYSGHSYIIWWSSFLALTRPHILSSHNFISSCHLSFW